MSLTDSSKIALKGIGLYVTIVTVIVLLLNWFWTGTGDSPNRMLFPPLSNDPKEFIEYGTLLAALLGFTAALFSPIVVFLIYNAWKEQKLYDLRKEIINNIIFSIDKTHYKLLQKIGFSLTVKKVDDNGQVLPFVIDNIEIDTSEIFSVVYSNIRIYKKLTGMDFNSNFRHYESCFMALQTLNREIKDIYKPYYDKIPFDQFNNLPKGKNGNFLYNNETISKYTFRDEILEINNFFNENKRFKYHGDPIVDFEATYEGWNIKFKEEYEKLLTSLVNELRP